MDAILWRRQRTNSFRFEKSWLSIDSWSSYDLLFRRYNERISRCKSPFDSPRFTKSMGQSTSLQYIFLQNFSPNYKNKSKFSHSEIQSGKFLCYHTIVESMFYLVDLLAVSAKSGETKNFTIFFFKPFVKRWVRSYDQKWLYPCKELWFKSYFREIRSQRIK